MLPENLILAYCFQMADSITTWSYSEERGVRKESAIFSCNESHTSLSPWCTDSCQSLGKTLVSNSHIILNQTEVVAQWKCATLDLVHTQWWRNVGFFACQIKTKFKCFQFPFFWLRFSSKLLKGLSRWRRHKLLCNKPSWGGVGWGGGWGCLGRRTCHLQKAILFSVPILTTWAREQPSYSEWDVLLISFASEKMSLWRCLKYSGGRWYG